MAAAGHADAFSDIDIRWDVPSPDGAAQLESLRATLERIDPCGDPWRGLDPIATEHAHNHDFDLSLRSNPMQ